MVDNTKDNNLDSEIAKRLDDLFGEGGDTSDEELSIQADDDDLKENKPVEDEQPETEVLDLKEVTPDRLDDEQVPDDYPLAELKNLVLSIDWEITEEALTGLLTEIDGLKKTYKNEKIISMFLQLLASLGQYIKINRGNAHPKTFKILNSVFSSLEEVTLSDRISDAEKKKLLRTEMQNYKQLRNKVSKKKAAAAGRKEGKATAQAEPRATIAKKQESMENAQMSVPSAPAIDMDLSQPPESLAEAVKELKNYIHSELNALKQEIKKLQKPN